MGSRHSVAVLPWDGALPAWCSFCCGQLSLHLILPLLHLFWRHDRSFGSVIPLRSLQAASAVC